MFQINQDSSTKGVEYWDYLESQDRVAIYHRIHNLLQHIQLYILR